VPSIDDVLYSAHGILNRNTIEENLAQKKEIILQEDT
jgi:hypothetical protein